MSFNAPPPLRILRSQAPILLVERTILKAATKAHLLPPHPLRVVAANSLLILIATPLFFGPADTHGFASRNLEVGQQLWTSYVRPLLRL